MSLVDTLSSVVGLKVYSETIDLASVAANTVTTEALTVTGVLSDDIVLAVIPPSTVGIGICSAVVTAADEVTVVLVNPTASPIDAASGTFKFVVAPND